MNVLLLLYDDCSEIDQPSLKKNFRAVYQYTKLFSPSALLVPYRDTYRGLFLFIRFIYPIQRLDFNAEFYAAKTRQLIKRNNRNIRI